MGRDVSARKYTAAASPTIGTALICFCVLANLGYSVWRDWRQAESTRLAEERQGRIYLDNQRRSQTKEAWRQSLKNLDVGFRQWAESGDKRGERASIDYAWVKAFSISDVEWIDSAHANVRSIFGAIPSGSHAGPILYLWSRQVRIAGDGVDTWWESEEPQFKRIATKPEFYGMKTVEIYDRADHNHSITFAR